MKAKRPAQNIPEQSVRGWLLDFLEERQQVHKVDPSRLNTEALNELIQWLMDHGLV
jgi:hypothetical protein